MCLTSKHFVPIEVVAERECWRPNIRWITEHPYSTKLNFYFIGFQDCMTEIYIIWLISLSNFLCDIIVLLLALLEELIAVLLAFFFSFQRLMLIIQWSNKVTVPSGLLWIVFETWCAYILRFFALLAGFNSSSLVWLKLFESNIFLTHVFCEYLWFVVFCFCLLFMYFDEIHELVKHLNLKWYQTIKSIISKLGYF